MIRSFLAGHGYAIEDEFSKGKYRLSRDGELISNAYLSGNYEGVRIVLGEIPEPESKPKKKYHIPADAYFSPGAIYERWEEENEND